MMCGEHLCLRRAGVPLLFLMLQPNDEYPIVEYGETGHAFLTYHQIVSFILMTHTCDRAHQSSGNNRCPYARTHTQTFIMYPPIERRKAEKKKNPNKFYDSNSFLGYNYIFFLFCWPFLAFLDKVGKIIIIKDIK